MKLQSVTANYSSVNNSRKNVSFGDDVGGQIFTYKQAMAKLRDHKYVVKGYNNMDAFGTLYDEVNNVLRITRLADQQKKRSIFTTSSEYEVVNWDMNREKFVSTMSKFWETCKGELSKIKEAGKPLDNLMEKFLVNVEGMKKPGFWAGLLGGEYYDKMGAMEAVFTNFIKTGLHKLK